MRNFIIFSFVVVFLLAGLSYLGRQIFDAWEKSLESQLTASLLGNLVSVSRQDNQRQLATLIFVGDIMLSRAVGRQMEKYNNYTFPFQLSADFLKGADITFGNLEGPISARGENQGSIYSFRAHPEVVEGLIYAGFDVLSLANNHIWDWGREALFDTLTILKDNRIIPVGAGENFDEANSLKVVSLDADRLKIGFLAYTNLYPKSLEAKENQVGISRFDIERILKLVAAIKEKREADILVVSLHWGNEYEKNASQWQKKLAHQLIDAGADIIVGHHPHVVQEIERYKKGIIFYSLGNFVFDQNFSKETMEGLAVKVFVSKKGIESEERYKVVINRNFQPEIH